MTSLQCGDWVVAVFPALHSSPEPQDAAQYGYNANANTTTRTQTMQIVYATPQEASVARTSHVEKGRESGSVYNQCVNRINRINRSEEWKVYLDECARTPCCCCCCFGSDDGSSALAVRIISVSKGAFSQALPYICQLLLTMPSAQYNLSLGSERKEYTSGSSFSLRKGVLLSVSRIM